MFFNYHCIHNICVDFIINRILANRIVGLSGIFRNVMRVKNILLFNKLESKKFVSLRS